MNKVYAVWQGSGEWEDYREGIVGVYSTKEKAETLLDQYEALENEAEVAYEKCRRCPLADLLKEGHEDYCEYITEAYFDEDGDAFCPKEIPWYDRGNYWIKEYEVK